jgi:hypothetical protein
MSKWFWRIFFGMYLVLFVAIGLRMAWEFVKPVLPPLFTLFVICGICWLIWDWRRNRWW